MDLSDELLKETHPIERLVGFFFNDRKFGNERCSRLSSTGRPVICPHRAGRANQLLGNDATFRRLWHAGAEANCVKCESFRSRLEILPWGFCIRPRHCATAFGRGRHGGAAADGWAGCRPTRGGRAGATGYARGAPHSTIVTWHLSRSLFSRGGPTANGGTH